MAKTITQYEKNRERYAKLTKEQKDKLNETQRFWRECNPLTDEEKEKLKQYQKEIREIRKERGLCIQCDSPLDNIKFVTCSKCLEKNRKSRHQNKITQKGIKQ